jgi:ribosome-associated toxin RatA of RatAB toxin-antitoxin module
MSIISANSFLNATVKQEFLIDRERLFAISQDHNKRLEWDEYLVDISLQDKATSVAKGVKAATKTKDGVVMETVYTEVVVPSRIAVTMLNHSKIFKEFYGEWQYHDISEDQSSLTISYSYKLRFPFNLIKHAVRKRLVYTNQQRLLMLKRFVEL